MSTAFGTAAINSAQPGAGILVLIAAIPVAVLLLLSVAYRAEAAMNAEPGASASEDLYQTHCSACHQRDGSGVPGVFPALAGNERVVNDPLRAVDIVLGLLSGMPQMQHLSDEEIVRSVNYALTSWGNDGTPVTVDQVADRRVKLGLAERVAGDYVEGGAEPCLRCHDAKGFVPVDNILKTPHGLAADARTPMAADNRQCQTCHGPSWAHLTLEPDGTRPPPARVFNREASAADKNRPCLDCHQSNVASHFTGSAHHLEDVSCTDCHSIHVDLRDPVLVIELQPAICFECHQQRRADFLRPHRHPVRTVAFSSETGLLACTDCHTPHGGPGPSGLKKLTLNETCYDCHAERRGPFLWEHQPVREDCTNCHVPHGSVHASLLKQRPPWLCQQCHSAAFHPSSVRSGLGVPPLGAEQQILGQACVNCHTKIHGSNHPSGVRFTR